MSLVAALVAAMSPVLVASLQSPPKRVVVLSILRPNLPKDVRPSQVTTLEGGMGTVVIPDVGQFGFTPSFKKDDDKTVVVTISDTSTKPARELGKLDVPVGGDLVQSKTTPSFGIRITRVMPPK